ncbi:cell division protein ZapA [Solilutibacter tolerans]|uniref:Cell division protein ZapA n=1 Tax=Solilutibacter tolerans TaxID=1604334 RepID=A0A1N6UI31_9GAMM|nr:cell division protein ZapA [Lysobacter tolerans]SIQ65279.1 cell division protein ZapA [Lysobacter tolerans]
MSAPEGKAEPVNVRILDREYTVGVTEEERESLVAASRVLDSRMRELRGNNRMVATERVAVLAALNLAHELEILREENRSRDRALASALDALERRLAQLPQE